MGRKSAWFSIGSESVVLLKIKLVFDYWVEPGVRWAEREELWLQPGVHGTCLGHLMRCLG